MQRGLLAVSNLRRSSGLCPGVTTGRIWSAHSFLAGMEKFKVPDLRGELGVWRRGNGGSAAETSPTALG